MNNEAKVPNSAEVSKNFLSYQSSMSSGHGKGFMATTVASSIEPLLRADDVIRILAISRSQMYDLIRMGILPAPIKLGKCSRWRNSDILAAISR